MYGPHCEAEAASLVFSEPSGSLLAYPVFFFHLVFFFFLLLELMSGERLKLAEKFQRESLQLISGTKVTGADILRDSATFSKESKSVDFIE